MRESKQVKEKQTDEDTQKLEREIGKAVRSKDS